MRPWITCNKHLVGQAFKRQAETLAWILVERYDKNKNCQANAEIIAI